MQLPLSALAVRAPSSLGRPRGHCRSRGQPADTPRPLLLCHEPAPHVFLSPLFSLTVDVYSLPPPTPLPRGKRAGAWGIGWPAGGRTGRSGAAALWTAPLALPRLGPAASPPWLANPVIGRDGGRCPCRLCGRGWSHRGKSGDGAWTREGHPASSAGAQRGRGEGSVCGRANSPSQGLAEQKSREGRSRHSRGTQSAGSTTVTGRTTSRGTTPSAGHPLWLPTRQRTIFLFPSKPRLPTRSGAVGGAREGGGALCCGRHQRVSPSLVAVLTRPSGGAPHHGRRLTRRRGCR